MIGGLPHILLNQSQAALVAGRLQEALRAANEGIAIAEDTGQQHSAANLRGVLARITAMTGDEDRCMELAGGRCGGETSGIPPAWVWLRWRWPSWTSATGDTPRPWSGWFRCRSTCSATPRSRTCCAGVGRGGGTERPAGARRRSARVLRAVGGSPRQPGRPGRAAPLSGPARSRGGGGGTLPGLDVVAPRDQPADVIGAYRTSVRRMAPPGPASVRSPRTAARGAAGVRTHRRSFLGRASAIRTSGNRRERRRRGAGPGRRS